VATKAVGTLDVRSSALTGLVDYDGFSAPTPGRGGARLDGVAQSLRECSRGRAGLPLRSAAGSRALCSST
jgi:hypothetical protein